MVSEFIGALLFNPFLFAAFLAASAVSVAGGIVGSYVVVKRIVFISGSISHCVLGGMGFFLWLQRVHGIEWAYPTLGALVAALIAALLVGWIHLFYREREDTVIAAVWAIGMSLGIVFISQTPGYNVELTNFLLGNILWVSPTDLYTLLLLDLCALVIVAFFHTRFLAICFDEEQARLQGLPVTALYMLLLVLTALTTVLLIQVVGIVLVITMLAIPPAIANLCTRSLSHMIVLAVCLSFLFSVGGLFAAFSLDWPVGASIALTAGMGYLLVAGFKKLSMRFS